MENRNEELQRQETKAVEISSTQRFELAKQSKKIKFANEKEIRQALTYSMMKIGLRAINFPKGEEKILLIQHVIDNFGGNTLDEIRLAFDWGIEGRLDEDINCFENFSCLYFTRIMRAYNRLACKVRDEAKEKPKALPHGPVREEPQIEDPEAYEKFMQTGFAQILKSKGIEIPKF